MTLLINLNKATPERKRENLHKQLRLSCLQAGNFILFFFSYVNMVYIIFGDLQQSVFIQLNECG